MQQGEVIEIYSSHKYLIEGRVTHYSRTLGTDKEELMSEGKIAFLKCLKAHKKKQAKFSTLLWPYLQNSMFNLAKANLLRRNRFANFSSLQNDNYDYDPPAKQEPTEFQIWEGLSKQAIEAIQIILDNELTHLSQLTAILIEKGYKTNPNNHIQKIYREIRQAIDKGKRRKTNHDIE